MKDVEIEPVFHLAWTGAGLHAIAGWFRPVLSGPVRTAHDLPDLANFHSAPFYLTAGPGYIRSQCCWQTLEPIGNPFARGFLPTCRCNKALQGYMKGGTGFRRPCRLWMLDRKSVVKGKSVSVRV